MKKQRLYHVIKIALLLLGTGIGYALLLTFTDFRIPCLFFEKTGLYCPGCGISTMCMALLHLDILAAFTANPALMILLPILVIILIPYISEYIQKGHWHLRKWQTMSLLIILIFLILFGIFRNLGRL